MQVTVTVTGLDEAIAKNNALADLLHDWTEALTGLGKTLTDYFGSAPWVTDGAVFGERWRALRDTTIREKTRKMSASATGIGGGAQPLIQTGAMKAGFRFEASPNRLFIDNKMPYWKFHQTGTGAKGDGPVPGVGRGRNLPERMTAGVNEPVKALIQAAIGEAVQGKIKEAMG